MKQTYQKSKDTIIKEDCNYVMFL